MKEKKTNLLLGAGPSHLFYHAFVLALIITTVMVLMWTILLSFQRMPTHDLNQLPSFYTFLLITISGIATMVFGISFGSAIFGLWLKCGSNHLYFYRVAGVDSDDYKALRKYLEELNFVSEKSDFFSRNNLSIYLKTDDATWILMLRPRAWNPNLKLNQELQEVAWHIQKFVEKF